MRHRKFNPGDKVRILPSWWEQLASEKNSYLNEYVKNGIDYVYTVDHYSGRDIYLEGYPHGWWTEEYLILVDSWAEESESEISIDGLI